MKLRIPCLMEVQRTNAERPMPAASALVICGLLALVPSVEAADTVPLGKVVAVSMLSDVGFASRISGENPSGEALRPGDTVFGADTISLRMVTATLKLCGLMQTYTATEEGRMEIMPETCDGFRKSTPNNDSLGATHAESEFKEPNRAGQSRARLVAEPGSAATAADERVDAAIRTLTKVEEQRAALRQLKATRAELSKFLKEQEELLARARSQQPKPGQGEDASSLRDSAVEKLAKKESTHADTAASREEIAKASREIRALLRELAALQVGLSIIGSEVPAGLDVGQQVSDERSVAARADPDAVVESSSDSRRRMTEPTGEPQEIANLHELQWIAEQIVGRQVVTNSNEPLGRVVDLLVDHASNAPHVLIDLERSSDGTVKQVTVPMANLRFGEGKAKLQTHHSADVVSLWPAYEGHMRSVRP